MAGRPKGSTNKKKEIVIPEPRHAKVIDDINSIRCPMCGKRQALVNYYQSNSPIYASNQGKMVFCKECVFGTYDTYYNIIKDIRNSLYVTCMKFDIPFDEGDYEGMVKQCTGDLSIHPMKTYMQKINSLGAFNKGLTGFDPRFILGEDTSKEKTQDMLENEVRDLGVGVKLNEQDLQVKGDVIRLLSNDPFAGYSNFDQKFLYNELISYLDEDTLDDTYKLSQILQLVNNVNQIRKIDLVIANMSNDIKSLVANQGEIKSLTSTKKTIVDNTDKIAKENSISVKNRGDKSAGKSTLTHLMKNYRELGFEDAEQDYYDQQKAYGMKLVADISNRSILDQLQPDENDMNEIIVTQRGLLSDLQSKLIDLEEENRKLHTKLGKEVASAEMRVM